MSLRYAAWGTVLLATLQLGWQQFRPGSDLRRTWAAASQSDIRRKATQEQEYFAQIARQTGASNIQFKLTGAAGTNGVMENRVSYVYYRFAYTLYPRRIYAGPADSVINNGNDLMRIQFNPGQRWQQEHHVNCLLTYGNELPGEPFRLHVLPLNDEAADRQSQPTGGN
jgi:hypothetical protein